MTDVRLDVDGAVEVVAALEATAGAVRRTVDALSPLARRPPLGWTPIRLRLVALAVAVDASAEHLRTVRAVVVSADGGGGFGAEVRLTWNGLVGAVVPTHVRASVGLVDIVRTVALGPWHPGSVPEESSTVGGDPGGTFSLRPVADFDGGGSGSPTAAGRSAVATLVAETSGAPHRPGDPPQAAVDEFQLIDHGGRTFTVVLGGVTDLSSPEFGLGDHRSARDLDAHALDTALDHSTGDDAYARVVADAVRHAGVPPGSRLLVVGHSYGAAAAVHLAADPVFNGDDYEVTHVVATGFHVDPWLPLVAPDTEILAVKNRFDLVVGAEALADGLLIDRPGARHDALVRSFNGGVSAAGHSQEHYIAYLEQTNDPTVAAFLRSVAVTGFARPGEATAIDISMP